MNLSLRLRLESFRLRPNKKPANGIAAIVPKRLISFCWFWFKWGLIACVVGAALLVPYFYYRMDEEIRRRVEELLAQQYPGLQIKIHSAAADEGRGDHPPRAVDYRSGGGRTGSLSF